MQAPIRSGTCAAANDFQPLDAFADAELCAEVKCFSLRTATFWAIDDQQMLKGQCR